jgi:nicotinate-nucleotide adenylyltransferase
LASILTWQDWEELFSLANFVGVSRPGYDLGIEHLEEHLGNHPPEALTLIEVPALAISSTDCRARVRDGRPVWYLVPDGVVQYISKRQLYRAEGEPVASATATSAPVMRPVDKGNGR